MKQQHKQQQQLSTSSILFLFLLSALGAIRVGSAARYTVSGPTLTITLKEPNTLLTGGTAAAATAVGGCRRIMEASKYDGGDSDDALPPSSWFDWTKLSPTVHAGIQSQGPPLPKWFPALQSIRAGLVYTFGGSSSSDAAAASTTSSTTKSRTKMNKQQQLDSYLPTWLEATGRFALHRNSELQVQPSYQFATKEMNLQVQLSQGASYVFARLSNKNGSSSSSSKSSSSKSRSRSSRKTQQHHNNNNRLFLQTLRGSILWNPPTATARAATAVFRSIRISPTLDFFIRHEVEEQLPPQAACTIEAITGDRTKAVLHLERQHPTLAVVYAINDRNVVAPEINLSNGRMIYQWNCELGGGGDDDSGSSSSGISYIRTKVDPLSAIHITWTDASATSGGRGGGRWITDVRLPLEGHVIHGLAADIRVRRQFSF